MTNLPPGGWDREIASMFRAAPRRRTPWILLAALGAVLIVAGVFGFSVLIAVIAISLQAIFFVFFLRHLAFAMTALRTGPVDLVMPEFDTGYQPTVTILVACKNEQHVVSDLVKSLLAVEYPEGRRQTIIVDDASTDRTGAILDEIAARDDRLTVVHRPEGSGGGKSGALNDGLVLATGEIIVVFDADHEPRPDCVRRLVRHFIDPAVAAVQGRCEIGNAAESPLTELVALDYVAGYLVNEYGRQSLYRLPAYGGANCAVRASAVRGLGGWNPESVTEDTDLTLRLILGGSRVRYDLTAVDVEEGVVTLDRYCRQRYRWARGHQQAWRDYHRAVWRSPRLKRFEKIETTMFLLAFHMPVAAAIGVVVLILWMIGFVPAIGAINLSIFWMLLFLGPLLELGAGLIIAKAPRRSALLIFYFLPLFFVAMAVCSKAWIDGVTGKPYYWVRTPRSGEGRAATQAVAKAPGQVGRGAP
jgi:cellulose synthase/poly-beta-1,6-N-acetylglucosamine synthase-like glycosyltransferase